MWLRINFRKNWPDYYEYLYDPNSVGKGYSDVPDGQRQNSLNDIESMPKVSGERLFYYFGDGPYCVFGNIGNLLSYLHHEKEARQLIDARDTSIQTLLSTKDYQNLHFRNRSSRLHVAITLMKKVGYQFLSLKSPSNIDILKFNFSKYKQDGYAGIICVLKMQPENVGHLIAVVGDKIIDGATKFVIDLNKTNLNWCCGSNNVYVGIKKAYLLKLRKMRNKPLIGYKCNV